MMRRTACIGLLAGVLVAGTAGTATSAAAGGGFCCKPSKTIRLLPTDEGVVQGMLYGTAEIDECLGLSFLHVVVVGRVADQTLVIPVLPGIQPIIGDWITMTTVGREGVAKGEGVMSEMPLATVAGRELDVTDSSFTPLLIGQF